MGHIPIGSWLGCFPSERTTLLMLWVYYDGSGKSSDEYDSITLVGIAGSISVWNKFEALWRETLTKYNLESFHMSDAMSFEGQFKSWDKKNREDKRDQLILELFNVLARFRSSGNNLLASACTVLKDDYKKAKNEITNLRSPEAICVQICFNRIPCDIDPEATEPDKPEMMLFFDGNEEYLRTIDRVWRSVKVSKRTGWQTQIQDISAVNSERYLPIQASDLIAGVLNKRVQYPRYELQCHMAVRLHYIICDYKKMKESFPNG